MTRSSNEPASELIRAQDLKGVDLWSMPSFDPERPEPEPEPELVEEIEEVPLEEVQPLTLEELESIRQEAYNEGFAVGEREGFHSTQLKVRQEAEVALGARLASLEALMQHLFVPIADQDSQIERSMVELVGHVAREVIQRELRTDSSQIETVLRESLKLLPMGANNVRIFVNPQDFVQIKAMRERQEETWRILEDAALQPGGCRVETEHSRIDATIETRITQALAQMFDQLHEQYLHPTESDIGLELAEVEAQHVAEQARLHAEAQARAEAEAKIQAEARAKAQAEADARAAAEAAALAQAAEEAEAAAAAQQLVDAHAEPADAADVADADADADAAAEAPAAAASAQKQAKAGAAEHPPVSDPLDAVRQAVEASDAP